MADNHQGEGYLTKGGKYYRIWAAKSEKAGFLYCIWCNKEFMTKNITGNHGHEQTIQYKINQEKYSRKLEKVDKVDEIENSIAPNLLGNDQNIGEFENRLFNFCLSRLNF